MIKIVSVKQCVHLGDDSDDHREHRQHGGTTRLGDNQGCFQETDRSVNSSSGKKLFAFK